MKKIFILFFFSILNTYGQYTKAIITDSVAKNNEININPVKSDIQISGLFGIITTKENNKNWSPKIEFFEKSHEISKDKKELIRKKTQFKINERNKVFLNNETSKREVATLTGINFSGNQFTGGFPPDNTIAISNGGIIVSAINSSVNYYNSSGVLLYSASFDSFFSNPSLTSNLYDPVVHYDSGSDRFILVVLHGTSSTTSKVLVCFSKSNNPLDGWWTYNFTGNPLHDNSWFDYPKIGVSNAELFITGNLYSNSGAFNQSVIFQISKFSGYSGRSINWSHWNNLSHAPFTLTPISYGQQGNYGPGLYFVSTDENGYLTDKLRLYIITDNLSGNPTIHAYSVDGNFKLAGDALQLGTNVTLSNGDNRGLNGFYLNGYIHFVFNSEFTNNYNGINYNRIKLSTLNNTYTKLGLNGYDYSYPAVVSYATSRTDKSVMIAFLRSGSNIYPQIRVVKCDNAMNWSPSVLIKSGNSYANPPSSSGNGSSTRWGDYTGICRKHNATSSEIWLGAQYGNVRYISGYGTVHCLDTWIAQVTDGHSSSITENNVNKKAKVFPNPIYDMFRVEFYLEKDENIEIMINDLNGKQVKLLYKDIAREGKNVFSFNRNALSKGLYFLNIYSKNKKIRTVKIIVE